MQRYLDFNATCPPLRVALEAANKAASEAPGNPSSLHWAGRAARRFVDDARDKIAAYIGTEPGSVVFTSGGTESNNIAIHSVLSVSRPGSIITSAIEHPAVLKPLERFSTASAKEQGWSVTQLRPDTSGVIDADKMIAAISADTRLVCLMLANNESGAVQPVQQVADYCREHGIPMLVDAVQALGKGRLDFKALGIDFMSLSGHKIGGPKGVGVLLVRRGVKLLELSPGGGQERGRRSGTENVPGIAGFAAALGEIDFNAFAPMRDLFEAQMAERLPSASIIGRDAERTPNTSLVILPGMDGETLLMQLDLAGFAVASGSACSSGKRDPSHVLMAMGMSEQMARSSIRVSFGPGNSEEDAMALVDALVTVYQRLRKMAGMAA
ncbi:cysteine desulfurase [Mariprofundus micogutta]|uniref:cysteine desulfurase n=1 Tax=Mariprofundus micogutta TaxID=1921010 RepID=A0A1L8CM43_9PROT|nr:cysteine desulfurase family protein [Mariprofundus micogutta]GAV19976.1 cysteine desulfurase [Mariprofundus micogutta]